MVIDKKALVSEIASQARLTQPQASDALNAVISVLKRSLKNGHAIELDQFAMIDTATRSDGLRAIRLRQHSTVTQELNP